MSAGADGRIVEVCLLGFPLDVYRRTQQHNDELLREFSLIDFGVSEGVTRVEVPARLLALTEEIRARYAPESAAFREQVDAAEAQGEVVADIVTRLPAAARDALVQVGVLLDEAEAFCREGAELLTMATPPDLVAFRRWLLGQVVSQIDGAEPVPWSAQITSSPPDELAEAYLPPEPSSASEARRFVRGVLSRWQAEALEDAAVLLTNELITNALLHARTEMKLRLRRRPGLVRIEVVDDGAGRPVRRRYDDDASTGRGLALVEAMAEDWGVEPANGGKAVWFTLPLDRAG